MATKLLGAAAPCCLLRLLLLAVYACYAGAASCRSHHHHHHHRHRASASSAFHTPSQPPRPTGTRAPLVPTFGKTTLRRPRPHAPHPRGHRRCPPRLGLASRRDEHHPTPVVGGLLWPSSAMDGDEDEDEGGDRQLDDEEDDDGDITRVFDAIIKIYCTHSEPDHLMPWQRRHQTPSTSSGFVVNVGTDGRQSPRIMTNAHSVEYATMVRVQRRGDGRKFEAVVEVIGNECDLAILRVDSPQFWGDGDGDDGASSSPLADLALNFGPLPALQDEVEVLGYPTGGDSMSVTSGVVSRIEMQEYVQAGMHLLAMQIDAAINAGNSGGPVLDEDLRVVGVAFQSLDSAENIGYVVPVTVVGHFLEDVRRHGGRYTGFCSLGVTLSFLENVAHRKYLGLTREDQSGVAVREIQPTAAAAGLLRPEDVILGVDGIPVSNDGKIPFRPGERVALGCYTQTKFPGDSVTLSLLRSGKEMEVDVPVSPSVRLVPAHWNDRPSPYLIVSGLVFVALSVPFLDAAGAWGGYVSDNVSYLLGRMDDPLEREGDQVVVLAQVLAHRSNLGYDGFSDLHLLRLNGERVRSLRHLEHLLCHPGGDDEEIAKEEEEFVRFEFAPTGQTIVLERSSLGEVTREVCGEHCIQRPSVLLPPLDARDDDGDHQNHNHHDDDDAERRRADQQEPIEGLPEPVLQGPNAENGSEGHPTREEGKSC